MHFQNTTMSCTFECAANSYTAEIQTLCKPILEATQKKKELKFPLRLEASQIFVTYILDQEMSG